MKSFKSDVAGVQKTKKVCITSSLSLKSHVALIREMKDLNLKLGKWW